MRVTGEFEVKLESQSFSLESDKAHQLARMSLQKTFKGELEAESTGEMLSVRSSSKGTAGYVALEKVHGQLSGKKGSFVLMHFGVLESGSERLVLEVVPGTGTDQLASLKGSMSISIEDNKHLYDFYFEF